MKCGAPVIVGNKTSLPEVVGDAALMVDPFDVNAIAGAIEKSNRRFRLSRGTARQRIGTGETV